MNRPLNREQWAKAVAQRRSVGKSAPSFREAVGKRKAQSQPTLSSLSWQKRIELSREKGLGGGRSRALVLAGKAGKRQRKTGGMLKSNSRQGPDLTEEQRKSLPKTGHLVPKKGINATGWAYDHRSHLAKRHQSLKASSGTEKKGINAEKWHYDHEKAMADAKKSAGKMGRANTSVSAEKKRTQAEAMAKHQPRQPKQPTQPQSKAVAKPPSPKRVK